MSFIFDLFRSKRQRLLNVVFKHLKIVLNRWIDGPGGSCPTFKVLSEETQESLEFSSQAVSRMKAMGMDSLDAYNELLTDRSWNRTIRSFLTRKGCKKDEIARFIIDPDKIEALKVGVYKVFEMVIRNRCTGLIDYDSLATAVIERMLPDYFDPKSSNEKIVLLRTIKKLIKKILLFTPSMAWRELLRDKRWNDKVRDVLENPRNLYKGRGACQFGRRVISKIKLMIGNARDHDKNPSLSNGYNSRNYNYLGSCTTCGKRNTKLKTCPICHMGEYCCQLDFQKDWKFHQVLYHS